MFVAVNSQRKRIVSVKLNDLKKPMCQTFTCGPLITPLAEVPKRPTGGPANAAASNQRLTVLLIAGQVRIAQLIRPDRHDSGGLRWS